jgi:crotonobetainyl-CoA:carnitine CoA-transferase CaiB-like acyl-CoA transferase
MMMFAVQNDREWRRFCETVMADRALADDERFSTNSVRLKNRALLESLIEGRFRGHSRSEVAQWLERADIATADLNDVPTVANHPQLAARRRWATVESPGGTIPALIPPHNLQGAPARMGAIPALGQHTAEILQELAVDDA